MGTTAEMYPELIKFRAPPGMHAALHLAARRQHRTLSEMVRQLLLRELAQYGLTLDEPDDDHPLGRAISMEDKREAATR